ncbi:hypothetical protein [Clostridium baratii]|uniref:hypothetical protein n=1 Tax=Clostridium baratii TaxID=1561 RepID=UPI00290B27FE|nr:hypothetical protein [Clostridium baratii]MDU3299035.1 hypothetical protein [Clostridioides difficile]MDU4912851.1 hypothetical protein [Clostridium baratii]
MNSIVSYPTRGEYGDNKYRGNATGKLLIDLHKIYKFDEISDYMSGSFTTADVGKKLGIITNCYDLNGLKGEKTKFDLIENDIKEIILYIGIHLIGILLSIVVICMEIHL